MTAVKVITVSLKDLSAERLDAPCAKCSAESTYRVSYELLVSGRDPKKVGRTVCKTCRDREKSRDKATT
jgi:hypothetical protein